MSDQYVAVWRNVSGGVASFTYDHVKDAWDGRWRTPSASETLAVFKVTDDNVVTQLDKPEPPPTLCKWCEHPIKGAYEPDAGLTVWVHSSSGRMVCYFAATPGEDS